MIVPRQIRDLAISIKNILEALDHNLTIQDNFASGQGSAIADADGTLASVNSRVNAILAEMRRQGQIS